MTPVAKEKLSAEQLIAKPQPVVPAVEPDGLSRLHLHGGNVEGRPDPLPQELRDLAPPQRLYGAMRERFAAFASYKTPVLPHLANVESAGYDRRDVVRRIRAARARLEPARGARSAHEAREPGPVVAQP